MQQSQSNRQQLGEVMEAFSTACKHIRHVLINKHSIQDVTVDAVEQVFQLQLRACPYVHAIMTPNSAPYISASPFGIFNVVLDASMPSSTDTSPQNPMPATTFAIYERSEGLPTCGRDIIAASLCMHSQDWLREPDLAVFSCGHGTHGFTFSSEDTSYRLTAQDLHLPAHGSVAMFDTNPTTITSWPLGLTAFVHSLASGTGAAKDAYILGHADSVTANVKTVLFKTGIMGAPLQV